MDRKSRRHKQNIRRRIKEAKRITSRKTYLGRVSIDEAISMGGVIFGHSKLKTDILTDEEMDRLMKLTGAFNKDLNKLLDAFGLGENTWLWCLHCERFFQARDIRREGSYYGVCAFEDCNGGGIGMDLFVWDSYPKQNPHLWEKWPKSTSELTKGMRCSID